ncbi:MAG: hypothetical protein JSR25_05740 [Proteobacteria bacterium]|nr:hypothetical protein [Pseudomonadota bacterium]
MDNQAWIKVGKLDLSSRFPALEFVAICHVALHTFHACSSARMFAPELPPGSPEILSKTAMPQFPFSECKQGRVGKIVRRDVRGIFRPIPKLPSAMTLIACIDDRLYPNSCRPVPARCHL